LFPTTTPVSKKFSLKVNRRGRKEQSQDILDGGITQISEQP
jgi:hypothetical protein